MAETPLFCSQALVDAYARRHSLAPVAAMQKLLAHDVWPEGFRRNAGLISRQAQIKLLNLPVFIAGCGGLGGEMAAHLVQLGAGDLYLCDYDSFEESNLNRQRFCDSANLGRPKAEATAKALAKKAPWGSYTPIVTSLSAANLQDLLAPCAILIDCLDSVSGKQMLEKAAAKTGIAWLHGSVLQHEGFACLQARPDGVLARLYGPDCAESGAGQILSHVVAGTASLMVSLFLKWLENPAFCSSLIHADFSIPETEQFNLP